MAEPTLTDLAAMDDRAALEAAAEELEKLKETIGWKILMLQLKRDSEQARDEFATVDPHDGPAVARIQNHVLRLEWFADTIEVLIAQGFETEQLDEEQLSYADEQPGEREPSA